jgi:uncharacterized repeat protein (TIGR01451 family)
VTATLEDQLGNTIAPFGSATVEIDDADSAVSIRKIASPVSLSGTSGTVSFSAIVTNNSTSDLISVTSLVDSEFGNIAPRCNLALPATLLPDGVLTCTFSATVSGSSSNPHINVVTAGGSDDDGNSFSVTASAIVTFADPPDTPTDADVAISLTASPTSISVGGQSTLRMNLRNIGPATATGIEVDLTLPPGLSFVASGGSGSFNSTNLTWSVSSLARSASVARTVTVQGDAIGLYTAVAEIEDLDQFDPVGSNDVDSAQVGVAEVLAAGTISGTVFTDTNGNGNQDAGESGIPGVTVEATDTTTDVTTTVVTNSFGEYVFVDVGGSSYGIQVDETTIPSGSTATTAQLIIVDLPENQAVTGIDFGFTQSQLPDTGFTPDVVALFATGVLALGSSFLLLARPLPFGRRRSS